MSRTDDQIAAGAVERLRYLVRGGLVDPSHVEEWDGSLGMEEGDDDE